MGALELISCKDLALRPWKASPCKLTAQIYKNILSQFFARNPSQQTQECRWGLGDRACLHIMKMRMPSVAEVLPLTCCRWAWAGCTWRNGPGHRTQP